MMNVVKSSKWGRHRKKNARYSRSLNESHLFKYVLRAMLIITVGAIKVGSTYGFCYI